MGGYAKSLAIQQNAYRSSGAISGIGVSVHASAGTDHPRCIASNMRRNGRLLMPEMTLAAAIVTAIQQDLNSRWGLDPTSFTKGIEQEVRECWINIVEDILNHA